MITNFVSPRLLVMGGGSLAQAASVLAQFGLSRPLVVTDPWMVSSGTVETARTFEGGGHQLWRLQRYRAGPD